MLNSPVTRLGGKMRLRKKIIEQIPEHKCYVEPFFGAGWVYFGKALSTSEVINDLDGELVTLFRCFKHHSDELARYVDSELFSREAFRDHLKADYTYLTDIQRAARYYYLLNTSFGGQGSTFGYSLTSAPPKKFFNTASFGSIRDRLKSTYIEQLPYSDLLAKYDREDTFFFLDPPYLDTSTRFSPDFKIAFGKPEFECMALLLQSLKGKFILTVGDHPFMWELFGDFHIEKVNVGYSVSRSSAARKSFGELIIRNF